MQPKIKLNAVDVGSTLTRSVAGGSNVTLTAAEANNAILVFTGVLTGNIDVIVPNGPRQYTVNNATTGAFTLTVKTAAGTGIVVAQANVVSLLADGTNVLSVGGVGGSVTEPLGQIVYGTGVGVDSDVDLTYVSTDGTFYVNTTTGTSGSMSVVSPGNIGVFAADASGANDGGDVRVQAGSGSGGGLVSVVGGDSTTGGAGSVDIAGGASTGNAGGNVVLTGGDAGGNAVGGSITLTAGNSSGTGTGAAIELQSGAGGATGAGGDVTISGGQGGSTSGNGGRVTIRGGSATSGDNGSVVVGRSTTSATRQDDFLYVPTCTGTPTGTPATISGHSPIVVDTTNNKLYFYSGGAWRDAGP